MIREKLNPIGQRTMALQVSAASPVNKTILIVGFAIFLVAFIGYFIYLRANEDTVVEIVEASYGGNCASQTASPPGKNIFARGNATAYVKDMCPATTSCEFVVSAEKLGDPVRGCQKNLVIRYRCGNTQKIRPVVEEASGQTVILACR
jgi:hypothetical protein